MEINLNTNLGGLNGVSNTSTSGSKPLGDTDFSADTTELRDALGNAPDIRSDVVANARVLVNTDGYPPSDTIKSLAGFLASKLSSEN